MTAPYKPHTELATHTVTNQPPPFEDVNLCKSDRALQSALVAAGDAWAATRASAGADPVGLTPSASSTAGETTWTEWSLGARAAASATRR